MQEQPLLVVNFAAGPGAGKSTAAMRITSDLKSKGVRAELVTEYAKDLEWSGRNGEMSDQLYMLAKQHQRLRRLRGKVEVAISDSPLPLGLVYAGGTPYETPAFERLLMERFRSFTNLNFFVERTKDYEKFGRQQSEEEARALDDRIRKTFGRLQIPMITISGDAIGWGHARMEIVQAVVKVRRDRGLIVQAMALDSMLGKGAFDN